MIIIIRRKSFERCTISMLQFFKPFDVQYMLWNMYWNGRMIEIDYISV